LINFLFAQLKLSINEVKSSMKSGLKMDHLFHEFDHIFLISNSNAIKSELQVSLDEFFVYLVETVDKRGQIVLQMLMLMFSPNLLRSIIWPRLSTVPTRQIKNSSRVTCNSDFVAFKFEKREILPNSWNKRSIFGSDFTSLTDNPN